MNVSIKLSKEWAELARLLNKDKFGRRLNKNLLRAHKINGDLLKREITANINNGKYAHGRVPNAKLTIALKRARGGTPLVDTRKFLRKMISYEVISPREMEIGIKEGTHPEDVKVVAAVHDGATIPVTEEMRGLFAVLAQASAGRRDPSTLTGRAAELWASVRRKNFKFLPLSDSTEAIIIPPRPFLHEVLSSRVIEERIGYNLQEALAAAIVDMPPRWLKKM